MKNTSKIECLMQQNKLNKNNNIQESFFSSQNYFTLEDLHEYDWEIEVNPEKQNTMINCAMKM